MNEASKEERNGSRDPLWHSFSSLPLMDWTSGSRYTRKPVCPECVLEAPEPRDPRARVPTDRDWRRCGWAAREWAGAQEPAEGLGGHWLHPTHTTGPAFGAASPHIPVMQMSAGPWVFLHHDQ